jgi:hypothetical protein
MARERFRELCTSFDEEPASFAHILCQGIDVLKIFSMVDVANEFSVAVSTLERWMVGSVKPRPATMRYIIARLGLLTKIPFETMPKPKPAQLTYIVGGYPKPICTFVRVGRDWMKVDLCVGFAHCPECKAAIGEACVGVNGPMRGGHYKRRYYYAGKLDGDGNRT